MTLTLKSVSSNSASSTAARAPSFREKDAVCIEARAATTVTPVKPTLPRSFPYQLADMQIAAQLLRYQGDAPATYAPAVAFAYQQGRTAATAGRYGIQV